MNEKNEKINDLLAAVEAYAYVYAEMKAAEQRWTPEKSYDVFVERSRTEWAKLVKQVEAFVEYQECDLAK